MKKRGFTLIELIMVLFIMSLSLGICSLRFNLYNKFKADKEIKTMVNDVNYCKIKAMTTGRDYSLILNPSSYKIKAEYQGQYPIEESLNYIRIDVAPAYKIIFKPTGSPINPGSFDFRIRGSDDSEYKLVVTVVGGEVRIDKKN